MERVIFLIGGWGFCLDRFQEGKKGGLLSIFGWNVTFFTFQYLICSGQEYVDGVKNYSDYLPKSFNYITYTFWAYCGYILIRKVFSLAKQFENAEQSSQTNSSQQT